MHEPPVIRDFQPAVPASARPILRCRADNLPPGECFKRGFYGGLGLWLAFVVLNIVALVLFLLLGMLLGGTSAFLKTLLGCG